MKKICTIFFFMFMLCRIVHADDNFDFVCEDEDQVKYYIDIDTIVHDAGTREIKFWIKIEVSEKWRKQRLRSMLNETPTEEEREDYALALRELAEVSYFISYVKINYESKTIYEYGFRMSYSSEDKRIYTDGVHVEQNIEEGTLAFHMYEYAINYINSHKSSNKIEKESKVVMLYSSLGMGNKIYFDLGDIYKRRNNYL